MWDVCVRSAWLDRAGVWGAVRGWAPRGQLGWAQRGGLVPTWSRNESLCRRCIWRKLTSDGRLVWIAQGRVSSLACSFFLSFAAPWPRNFICKQKKYPLSLCKCLLLLDGVLLSYNTIRNNDLPQNVLKSIVGATGTLTMDQCGRSMYME